MGPTHTDKTYEHELKELRDRLLAMGGKVEDLIHELKATYTIVIVTHNMQQAARVSDQTAFFYMGDLVEVGTTEQIFTNPTQQRTEDYVTGKFG